jgi:putative flippase GtrA
VIGIVNTLLHGAILSVLVELAGFDVVLGNLIAFICANVFSYFANSYVTFKMPPSFPHYVRFVLTSLTSLALTLGIAWAAEFAGLHYWEGFIMIIAIVPAASYLFMKFWAFSRKA